MLRTLRLAVPVAMVSAALCVLAFRAVMRRPLPAADAEADGRCQR